MNEGVACNLKLNQKQNTMHCNFYKRKSKQILKTPISSLQESLLTLVIDKTKKWKGHMD